MLNSTKQSAPSMNRCFLTRTWRQFRGPFDGSPIPTGLIPLLRRSMIAVALADVIAGDGTVFGIGSTSVLLGSAFAPFVFSLLWGRQYGAGLVAALAAPWLVPATVVASLGYVVYWVLERVSNLVNRALQTQGLHLGA